MLLAIRSRNGRQLCEVQVEEQQTVYHLKEKIKDKIPKLIPSRQRLSMETQDSKRIVLDDTQSLKSYPLQDNSIVYLKDLGLQVSWKLVFFLEYLGPLVIVPLLACQPTAIYYPSKALGREQKTAVILWALHYGKRELETLFVHRFSHSTMPLMNLVKNCSYYWGFAALIGYFLCHPLYTPVPSPLFYLGICIFVLAECGNFATHWMLRQLRPPGSKARKIPRGFLFDYVSCPNYTLEIVAWLGFNMMSNTLLGWLFMLVGAIQMTLWAQKKHRQYLLEFDGSHPKPLYPLHRKRLIPFFY
ncbi:hypothetical protein GpartN1_g4633.t1 [Galdieria partita]|uniref:Ubiquitin-like domain-containing protein n=1 Tax=Galdieria partita TaxID=83374 RepID=A0A9C7PZQ4_9RHOD|nr:hypothetical protein GpartN1_g4633.t1 [Galdieria partita]